MLNSLALLLFYTNRRQSTAHQNNSIWLLPYTDTGQIIIKPTGHKYQASSTLSPFIQEKYKYARIQNLLKAVLHQQLFLLLSDSLMFSQMSCSISCIFYMTIQISISDNVPNSQMFLNKNLCTAQLISDMEGHTLLKSEQILYSVKLLCKTLLWGPFIK